MQIWEEAKVFFCGLWLSFYGNSTSLRHFVPLSFSFRCLFSFLSKSAFKKGSAGRTLPPCMIWSSNIVYSQVSIHILNAIFVIRDVVPYYKGSLIWKSLIEKSKDNVLSFSIQINVFIFKIQGGEGSGKRGSGWGETCIPMANSCWCMAKPSQYCKVINLQLNKLIKNALSTFLVLILMKWWQTVNGSWFLCLLGKIKIWLPIIRPYFHLIFFSGTFTDQMKVKILEPLAAYRHFWAIH